MIARRYSDPRAFRRALTDRLKQLARITGLPYPDLQRRFVLECFLARVFALPGERWLLKGGTGLAFRLSGARHSRDLDLCNTSADRELQACIEELINVGRANGRDPFVFDITRQSPLAGITEGIQLTVTVRLGATTFDAFPIDLTTGLTFVGPIQTVQKELSVQIEDVQPPPPMRLYPIEDQVADKVAAMYETHNGNPSGRYRDLVDLVLIFIDDDINIDTELLTQALTVQEYRRRMWLPFTMTSPGPAWDQQFATEASRANLPELFRTLTAALDRVGETVNPLLTHIGKLRN
jgi:predicted nucleotidyltransferase component of viral defense system